MALEGRARRGELVVDHVDASVGPADHEVDGAAEDELARRTVAGGRRGERERERDLARDRRAAGADRSREVAAQEAGDREGRAGEIGGRGREAGAREASLDVARVDGVAERSQGPALEDAVGGATEGPRIARRLRRGHVDLDRAVVGDLDVAGLDRLLEAEQVAKAKAARAAAEDRERRRRDRHGARRRDRGATRRLAAFVGDLAEAGRDRRGRGQEVARARRRRETFEQPLIERVREGAPRRPGARLGLARGADEDQLRSRAGHRDVGEPPALGRARGRAPPPARPRARG